VVSTCLAWVPSQHWRKKNLFRNPDSLTVLNVSSHMDKEVGLCAMAHTAPCLENGQRKEPSLSPCFPLRFSERKLWI
jgi:hypothetical protein